MTQCVFARLLCALFWVSANLYAAEIQLTDPEGKPLAGASVVIDGDTLVSNSRGLLTTTHDLETDRAIAIQWMGRSLSGTYKNGRIVVDLRPQIEEALVVTSTRGESLAEANLSESMVRRIPANVTGELLRQMPGVAAVRRGPVGLDPVVRGLRETEVGTYLDGSRLFPGGPGRMDSAISHLDPSAIQKIQVVKGPYALTWGAGNLSAIRVETMDTRKLPENRVGGNLLLGYHDNTDARYASPTVFGRQNRWSWWAQGVTRQSEDYEDGDGNVVPADMETKELRAKLTYQSERGDLTISAGYQEQRDIDYPGRLLNADFFDAENYTLRWDGYTDGSGFLQGYQVQVYHNAVDHGMSNDGKPTAEPNPNRMPPFALAIGVDSAIEVSGARFALDLRTSETWDLEVGADYYTAHRDALRTIARAETGMVMSQDMMWPDATISDGGLFVRSETTLNTTTRLSGTVRLDRVSAHADALSDFYLANTEGDTSDSETNLNGAVTVNTLLSTNWSLSFGLGSAVRTADANERYSDRIPASKTQMSAEFMGNPLLEPERSNQVDLWLEGSFQSTSININVYGRRIDDYITIEATDLPKRMPLSPDTVYRYVNGEAEFFGVEGALRTSLGDHWHVGFSAEYLRGRDLELDEPVLGVIPANASLTAGYRFAQDRHGLELNVRGYADQERISASRGETRTDGYTTVDLTSDWTLWRDLVVNLGVANLTDEAYTSHLNAKNPFTGQQIMEPGRRLFIDLRYRF